MPKTKTSVLRPIIRRATIRDINQVVRIHLQTIPYSLNSCLGLEHLSGAYHRMLKFPDCEVLVATKAGKIIAIGVLEYYSQAVATALLQSNSVRSIALLSLKIFRQPGSIFTLLQEVWSTWVFRGSLGPLVAQPHVLVIAVDAAFRNRGIGKMLLRALVVRANKLRAKYLVLETRRNNALAIRFYERSGFRIIKKSPFDFLLAKKI